jgi:hypothetical protein
MRRLYWLLLVVCVAVAIALAACGSSNGDDSQFVNPNVEAGTGDDGAPPILGGNDAAGDPDAQALAIAPLDQTLTYVAGQPAPTLTYTATTTTGIVVPASFTIDRGEIGAIGLTSGVFTPSGNVGGKATITATWNGKTASTSVTVKLSITDNGGTNVDAGTGFGGNGGVGGEGVGAAVAAGTVTVLNGTPTADPGLAFLYPYDKTVWPRGILAPLLQWNVGAQADYDAVRIHVEENSFTYDGYFTKTATPFIHHPIPQAAWKQMALSNGGEDVTVTLTFAKGGAAYGPITEKWKIASAPLKGTVYYNSYGTRLAKNFTGALGGDGSFGGATLAIKGSSTDPVLVAGSTGDSSKCRVCHSVAANGSKLVTQGKLAENRLFSAYDLKTGAETTMNPTDGTAPYAWPAIFPDGSMFLSDSSSAAGSTSVPNGLFGMPSGTGPVLPTPIATVGWPAGFRAAYPAFAPNGTKLAFTLFGGMAGADAHSLGVATFDNATKTFGTITKIFTPSDPVNQTAIYPSFLPTNDAIVFEVELRYNTRDYGGTRSDADVAPPDARASQGTRAELWWLDLKTGTAHRLDALDGWSGANVYLPTGGNAHDKDQELAYEPTVNPVPSGGYAWVVFTSRRLYGNVATINPFYSDPRYHDLTTTPTPKKLWVAAIDLNAAPGTDPSHPAFYLPAQELLAGNSRGYWVVDPCKADGISCETGDECCDGFCRPDADGGALVCTNQTPTCSHEFEKCTVDGDCCNTPAYQCINGRCALPLPR